MREYERVLSELEKSGQLTDYDQGWIGGVRQFAWMREGTYYVGTTGMTLGDAILAYLAGRGLWAK